MTWIRGNRSLYVSAAMVVLYFQMHRCWQHKAGGLPDIRPAILDKIWTCLVDIRNYVNKPLISLVTPTGFEPVLPP